MKVQIKTENLYKRIFGEDISKPLESRLTTMSLFIGIIFGVITLISNAILHLGFEINIISIFIIIMCSISFYFSRFKGEYVITSLVAMSITSFILYPYLWIKNGGSNGGLIYFYLFNSSYIAIVFKKKISKFFIPLQTLMIVALYGIEYYHLIPITPYANIKTKLLDQLATFLIVFSFLFIIIRWVMKIYKQKINELNATHEELNMTLAKLTVLSSIDELSGIYNRRKTFELLNEELEKTNNDSLISILMVDIDYFKKINDQYGHSVGDIVIKKVAEMINENLGKNDFVGRIGGEEFLIVFLNTDLQDAKEKSNDLRVLISEIHWEQEQLNVTISGGLFLFRYSENLEIDLAIEQADICLYEAKNNGRNCIITKESKI